MTKPVALYCRISSGTGDTDDLWNSLDRQKEKLLDLAKRDGATVAQVYKEVYTGVKDTRPDFQDLLARAERGEIGAVYVAAFDRLTRNGDLGELEQLRKKFLQLECDVITPSQAWRFSDPALDNPEARFLFRIQGAGAGYERDKIEQRMTEGREKKAKSGGDYGGAAPYGYRTEWEPKTGQKYYVVDETAAANVRRVFTDYLGGKGYKAIAAELNAAGMLRGERRWEGNIIRYMLRNAAYAGLTEYLKPWRRHALKSKGPTVVVSSIAYPPIIDVETFEQARQKMAERSVNNRIDVVGQRPLSGLLRCCTCGGGCVSQPGHGGRDGSYVCRSLKDPRLTCERPQKYPYREANRVVLEAVKAMLPAYLDENKRRLKARARSDRSRQAAEEIRRQIAGLEQQRGEMTRMAAAEIITREELLRDIQPIRAELDALKRKLERLEAQAGHIEDDHKRQALLIPLAEIVRAMTPEDPDLRELIKRVVVEVYVEKAGRDERDRRRWKLRVSKLRTALLSDEWITFEP